MRSRYTFGVLVLLDAGARPVIAHRGDSRFAPENTFDAFDRAIAKGADAIEFDVRLTRDGVPVVIHDATVDRTTDGGGPVEEMSFAELQRLDACARWPVGREGGGWRRREVPSLEEVLDRYRETPLLIEVKHPSAVEPTRRMLERFGASARTVVDSSDHEAVAPFRGGALATGASMREVLDLLARSIVGAPRSLPYEALCIPRFFNRIPIPVGLLAARARVAGVVTHVWTVNDVGVGRRLWQRGIQGLITDDPGAMLALRAELD